MLCFKYTFAVFLFIFKYTLNLDFTVLMFHCKGNITVGVSGFVKLICRSLIFVIWLKHLIRSVGFKYKLVHFLSSDHRSFCLKLHFWSLQLCTPKVFINDVYNCKQGCYGLQTAEKNGWIFDEIKYPV